MSYNGGYTTYPDRTTTKTFFRASGRYTKNVGWAASTLG